ncbi:right-handed parallel beta-helix repeat-containing protein [Massilia sp. IC2-476]|uniref:right-handed parallel beta-helix repeat-containing protein n=1 Tax=Massilia sp. IC2-476 TaxID=2887199 RepID=UPI001D10DFFC|nr:right-handed parallel beta-helix repeat-containing protein [Massilia sp. IC2-476]MCC2972576.1 right-handed parallel beta-helix repeat-containing protein [Massilia sp. IC2-476]
MSKRRDFLRTASGVGIAVSTGALLPSLVNAQDGRNANVHYIDPGAVEPGNGTLASPYRSWTSVSWTPGHTYLQKRGTTYSGVFQVSTSGTETQRINIGAYFGPDGSDDATRPKPIIVLPGAPTMPADGASIAVYGKERDFLTYRNLDIRNNALPDDNDMAIIWLGNSCIFENNNVSSNCAGVYIFEKSQVTVSNCVLDVIGKDSTRGNQGILVAGGRNMDGIRLLNNTVRHRGGGGTTSYGIRCETYNGSSFLTRLLIRGNRVSPPPGVAYNPNRRAIGIYLINGQAATLDWNTVTGMLTGIFINGGERSYVGNNNCSNNMNFGIHISGTARSYIIERNLCNANGGSLTSTYYGRGIELSSKVGQGAVSGHTIRYNTCMFNYNYGGPLDNGSEGVGIGVDDGANQCLVYGNLVSNNEGNGIQVYGGGDRARWPDTGGHRIESNLLHANCSFSVMSRRSGGKTPSAFQAHIALAYVYGSPTVVANNRFSGRTSMKIYTDGTNEKITFAGNV